MKMIKMPKPDHYPQDEFVRISQMHAIMHEIFKDIMYRPDPLLNASKNELQYL